VLAAGAPSDKAGKEETSRKDRNAKLTSLIKAWRPPRRCRFAARPREHGDRKQLGEKTLSQLQGQKRVTPLTQGETLGLQNRARHRWRSCQHPATQKPQGEQLLFCSVPAQSRHSPS